MQDSDTRATVVRYLLVDSLGAKSTTLTYAADDADSVEIIDFQILCEIAEKDIKGVEERLAIKKATFNKLNKIFKNGGK